jgi:anti-sigma factor RsiW
MMTCNAIQEVLSAYLDRELSSADLKEVQLHLATGCAACLAEERSILRLKETLRTVKMPGLPSDVLASIEAETVLKPRWWETGLFQRPWIPVAAGIGAAAVAGWLLMRSQIAPMGAAHVEVAAVLSTSPVVAMHQDPDREPVNEDVR